MLDMGPFYSVDEACEGVVVEATLVSNNKLGFRWCNFIDDRTPSRLQFYLRCLIRFDAFGRPGLS